MRVRVWFEQINQAWVDVEVPDTATPEQVNEAATRKWRREIAQPYIKQKENMTE